MISILEKLKHVGRICILLYARYSTSEQHPSSITDQFMRCKSFLKAKGVHDVDFIELYDAEMSGELVNRPGIDELDRMICERKGHLVVAEDGGRMYRDVEHLLRIVRKAVDHGIRVILINDDIDTADPKWEERITQVAEEHARFNRLVSHRVKRKHEGLWFAKAAIGLLVPGYVRVPTVLASMGQPAQGPFFDHIDPQWVPVVYKAYERIYNGEPPWSVAEWLTSVNFPKCANATNAAHTAKTVIAMIKRLDYRGVQDFRDTVCIKHFGSGKRKQRKNPNPEEVLLRDMPELRMVPDWLWHGANDAIKGRAAIHANPKTGLDHPLYGIPRDSRGPLSENFLCVICGAKMYQDGREEGGYRCGRARNRQIPCWNKATALRAFTHEALGKAIAAKLIATGEHLAIVVNHAAKQIAHDDSIDAQLAAAQLELNRLHQACQNYVAAIGKIGAGRGSMLELVTASLMEKQDDLIQCEARVEHLESLVGRQELASASPEQIAAKIGEIGAKLLEMDREAGVLVRQLAPKIVAVPCQQFLSDKVVLRAKFELSLAALLPSELQSLLQGDDVVDLTLLTVPMTVDLFEPSICPKFGLEAAELRSQGLTLVQVGKALGISKRAAFVASRYGEAMLQAGIDDPFIELTEQPAKASRWGRRAAG